MVRTVQFAPDIFATQSYGGISRYFVSLWEHLQHTSELKCNISAPLYTNEYLRKSSFSGGIYVSRPCRRLSRLMSTVIQPMKNVDIVHETYYHERYSPGRIGTVVTVYDMIHELYPDGFPADDTTALRKRAAVENADRVICISESTRRDLLSFIPSAERRTSVVHLGCASSEWASHAGGSGNTADVGKPYLLYVGKRDAYKNFDIVCSAYRASSSISKAADIVCFGGGARNSRDVEREQKYGLAEGAIKYVSGTDADLASYYRGAVAFVYPSLYEGFGIPPLEAMACGCPVIASGASSIPEVVSTAARIFDPRSLDDVREAISDVLFSPTKQLELRTLGYARSLELSWERCAVQTRDVYLSF